MRLTKFAIDEIPRTMAELGLVPHTRQVVFVALRRAQSSVLRHLVARSTNSGGFLHCSSTSSSIDGSAQCAQPGGVRLALPSAGNPPDRLRPHHNGRRTVAATPAAVPIALGDGGRCGGQNSSSLLDELGRVAGVIVEERPSRRQATLDAAPAAPHDSSALRKRMLLNRDHLPTCVSACVAW